MQNKEQIRIAQIMGKWVGGGVEAVIMNYYRHLDRNKIQFDFICDSDSTNIPYEEIKSLGGKVILIPPYQKIFKYIKELTKILKENKYKIVHSHINTLSVFPLYCAKKAKVPVRIAHSHSTTNKKEWKKNLMKQALRPLSKVFATEYFCCSEHAGRWLFGNKAYDKGKVYLLNNAIELDKFKYDEKIRHIKRKELGINDDTMVIGHIGRFVEQKNHEFLIDIFNELHKKEKNSLLILVGQGPLENSIKEKVNKLGLTNNCLFLGQRRDANELYQVFDLFLLPSLYEGLGMVAIEAQVAGLPCVISSEIPKVAKICDNVKFLNLNENVSIWVDTLLNSLSNKRNSLIKNAKNNGYDIQEESCKLENYYQNALNNNKIAFISSGFYPIPASKGGAVENLVQNILDKNEEYNNFNYVVFSIFDQDAKNQSQKYKHAQFNFYKPNIVIIAIDKLIYNILTIVLKKEKKMSYRYIVQRIGYLNYVSKNLKKNNYNKIIIENNATLFLALKWRKNYLKYDNKYYLHLHNDLDKYFGCLNIIRNCNKYLCVSKYVADKLQNQLSLPEEKIVIYKNCIDTKIFNGEISKFEEENLRKELDIPINNKIIIFTGRLIKEKGILELVKAFKKINDNNLTLMIIGSSSNAENLKSDFEIELAKETKNISNIIFTGFVPYNKLNKYYALSSIAVLPSMWEEPAGLTIQEAISSMVPLITTDSGGIPEYINDLCAIILKRDEKIIENIKESIVKLINDEEKIKTMKNEEKIIRQTYSLDRYYNKFTKIFNEEIN